MRLYHGSVVAVRKPSVVKGRKNVDFGRGFYTTTNYDQAREWAELKRRRISGTRAVVSIYEVSDDILDGMYPVRTFIGPTHEWLDFVVRNRRGEWNKSTDMTMGPVANDQLYLTIRLYEQGTISAEAAIDMLKTHTLFDQLAIHTQIIADQLNFIESIEL